MSDVPAGFVPIQSSNPFGGRNGPLYEKTEPDGTWRRGFLVEEHHCNQGRIAHGGMLMTFADILLARAVLDQVAAPFVTMRMVSDFVGPAPLGAWVEGKANVIRKAREIVFVEGQMWTRTSPVLSVNALFKRRAAPKS